jgi:hypothetical protein
MGKKLLCAAAAFISLAFSLQASPSVSIYADALPSRFGIAPKRAGIRTVDFSAFSMSGTRSVAERGGIPTLVAVGADIQRALSVLLSSAESVEVDGSVIKKAGSFPSSAYTLTIPSYGLSVSFALEKPSQAQLDEIAKVYASNPYWKTAVLAWYSERFVIRIFEAEDLDEPGRGVISFAEALFAATLLGDRDQWLWGIHDGGGILENLPLEVERRAFRAEVEILPFREYKKNADAMYAFIRDVEKLPGDFVSNLYAAALARAKVRENNDRLVLPEDFLSVGYGDSTEFALFFHDILTRKGYKTKLIAVRDNLVTSNGEGWMLLFRKPDDAFWGIVDDNPPRSDFAQDETRIPAIIYGHEVSYTEIDVKAYIEAGEFLSPPQDQWKRSMIR